MKNLIRRMKDSILFKNTLWMLLGQGVRIVIQAVYFVLIARSLGADGYGAFIAIVSLVSILAPFSSLGAGNLLIKNVACDQSVFRNYWGKALFTTAVTGSLLLFIVLLLSKLFLSETISLVLVSSIAVSDLLFARILDISGQAYQAFQRLNRTALIQILFSSSRLLAAISFILFFDSKSPEEWGILYVLGTAMGCLIGVILVCKDLGFPKLEWRKVFSEAREGIYFSLSLSIQGVYNDFDKTLLTKLSALEATGIYAAACRIVDVAFTPVRSLLGASYSKFFQEGASGIEGSIQFARKLLPLGAGIGLFSGIMLLLVSPVFPILLGDEYQAVNSAIQWLFLLPVIKSIHYFGADSLTGAGYINYRVYLQACAAALNIFLNLLLIPVFSWKGAIWASLSSDSFLAVGFWCVILNLYIQGRKATVKQEKRRVV